MSFLSGRRPEFILTTESQAGCGDPTSWPRTHSLNAAAENRLETLVTICLAPQSHRITPAEVTSRQQNNVLLVYLDCSATAIKTEATCSFRNHRIAWPEEDPCSKLILDNRRGLNQRQPESCRAAFPSTGCPDSLQTSCEHKRKAVPIDNFVKSALT